MSALGVVPADGAEALTAAVLSSLPLSYAPGASSETAAVAVIPGRRDWPVFVEAAVRKGSAVILVHPEPTDVSTIPPGSQLVIDSRWASNPAVAEAKLWMTRAARAAHLLEVELMTARVCPLSTSLLDAAALIRGLIGPWQEVNVLSHDGHGLVALGRALDVTVAVTIARTDATHQHAFARLLTDTGGVELTVPDPVTARPVEIVITDPDGARLLPTIWESGHRATWRRLHTMIANNERSTDLDDLRSDLATLAVPLHLLAR